MLIQKNLIATVLFFSLITSVSAQEKALSAIDVDDLKRHLTFIASDSLQGRKIGTETDGLEITANYLADESKKMGLKPGAPDYFQPLDLIAFKPDANRSITVSGKKKKLYTSQSFINLSGSSVVHIKSDQIVFAGFGYEDSGAGYNDLKNTDLKDKVVIIGQGNPKSYKTGQSFRWSNRLERVKMEAIKKRKPKAIVIITNPQDKENRTFQQISKWFDRVRYELNKPDDSGAGELPTLIALPEFADKILGKKGKFKKYLDDIVKQEHAQSIALTGKKVEISYQKQKIEVDAKNVIAVVEGSDAELKDECFVYMAHYDHVGVSTDGEVYNGADDNGSGTVTLLEVAEAFAKLEKKPKRSIVFLWVTAEEEGLLGSEFYSENPTFPLEKTVACINIDMDGRVYEPRDSVYKNSPKKVKDFDGLYTLTNSVWPELKEINTEACRELGIVPDYSLPSNFLRSSDHYHFHRKDVPILNYATGYHADYHKVGDEVWRINFEKMKRVADLCFLVGYRIANMDESKTEIPQQ